MGLGLGGWKVTQRTVDRDVFLHRKEVENWVKVKNDAERMRQERECIRTRPQITLSKPVTDDGREKTEALEDLQNDH